VQNVRRSAICSTLLPLVFKLSTGAFFCIYFVPCFGRSDCWCGYCVAFVCTPVMQLGVWKWGGGYKKNRIYWRRITSAVHASLAGSPGATLSPEKMNLGLVEMQFPSCLEGLTCDLQSLLSWYSITFSIPPYPPSISMRDPHFQKVTWFHWHWLTDTDYASGFTVVQLCQCLFLFNDY